MNNRLPLAYLFVLWTWSVYGQQAPTLTVDEAVERTMAEQFNIQLAKNASELAQVSASKYNTGQLPVVNLNGGANYNLDNTTANFQNGESTSITAAGSYAANASIAASYAIYDASRKYRIRQLQAEYDLSELQVKAAIENAIAQTMAQYYLSAGLSTQVDILQEALDISKERLNRVRTFEEYGQNSQLDILNAQVDLNSDSLNLINAQLNFDNAKRQLNRLMVDTGSINYLLVENAAFIDDLNYDDLKNQMLNKNTNLVLQDRQILIGQINIDLAKSNKLPRLDGQISYGYAYNNNNPASFLASLNTNGMSAGITAQYPIFDGGLTRVAEERARINSMNLQIQKEQIQTDLLFDFENAWANYQNALVVFKTEELNVELNRSNFERSEEQYKIGQINAVDYRQAQLNLFNAETRRNTARFDVKRTEVELLLLSGGLVTSVPLSD